MTMKYLQELFIKRVAKKIDLFGFQIERKELKWCGWGDLNPHTRNALPLQNSVLYNLLPLESI